jgi:hypothetical protein
VTAAFFRKLQEVTTKIHATANLGEIMLDLGLDFCELFNSDRFTLYAVTPDKENIVSKVKTGLASFRDLKLPIGPSSRRTRTSCRRCWRNSARSCRPPRPSGATRKRRANRCWTAGARYAGPDGRFTLYRAVGCAECTRGYRGRVGVHELMRGTDKAKRLLTEHARVAVLLAQALEDGMLTLKMDGIEKVLEGITDIKMVRAVCVK